jgi:DNA-damage-inducible protein D
MDKLRIEKLKTDFDSIVHLIKDENNEPKIEIWFARELMANLGYSRWEIFNLL